MSGAAAVPAALVHRTIDLLGCQFSILFGQTEMHGVISQTRITDAPADQADTVGPPLPQLEVKIADVTTGEIAPVGEQGEICCRGYQNMLAYYEMPEATSQTIDADGWLHMGDIGTMDDRGFLKVTGRLKDMIVRGGMNIYPREIEEFLHTHPAIAEAAVIGVPDEKWGEQIAAIVRLAPGAERPTAEEMRIFCRAHTSAHKTPRSGASSTRCRGNPDGQGPEVRAARSVPLRRPARRDCLCVVVRRVVVTGPGSVLRHRRSGPPGLVQPRASSYSKYTESPMM